MMKTFLRFLVSVIVLMSASSISFAESSISREELENGLEVILRPVEGGTHTAIVLLYNIGELHDPPGNSGLAHLIEHLYITAAAGDTPARTADAFFERYQWQANAQTTRDYTLLAMVFPNDQLEAELKDAGARMKNLQITKDDLARELPRLRIELDNMYGGQPALAAINHARAIVAPYPNDGRKGGKMEQIETVTVDQIKARLDNFYTPDHATLVLVGDFEIDRATKLIKDGFGEIARGAKIPGHPHLPIPDVEQIARKTTGAGGMENPPAAITSIGWTAPAPENDLYAPYLLICSHLMQSRMQQFDRRSPVMPMHLAPLDDPGVVFLCESVDELDAVDKSLDSLRELPAKSAAAMAQNVQQARMMAIAMFGTMLGCNEISDALASANPYFAALVLGRTHQTETDTEQLRERILEVTADDLERCVREVFGESRAGASVITIQSEP